MTIRKSLDDAMKKSKPSKLSTFPEAMTESCGIMP